jgi:hypothetical protein
MHIVPGELRKEPYIKSGVGRDGQSTLFIVELSEMTKDHQTGEKAYTNYSAAIFAKSPAQIDYCTSVLVKGNFIVVNCEKLRVEVKEYKSKDYITLKMEGARLEGAQYIQNAAPQQAAPQQMQNMQQAPQPMMQQAPQQAQQMQPANGMRQAPTLHQQQQQPQAMQPMHNGQAPANFDNFDKDIPF